VEFITYFKPNQILMLSVHVRVCRIFTHRQHIVRIFVAPTFSLTFFMAPLHAQGLTEFDSQVHKAGSAVLVELLNRHSREFAPYLDSDKDSMGIAIYDIVTTPSTLPAADRRTFFASALDQAGIKVLVPGDNEEYYQRLLNSIDIAEEEEANGSRELGSTDIEGAHLQGELILEDRLFWGTLRGIILVTDLTQRQQLLDQHFEATTLTSAGRVSLVALLLISLLLFELTRVSRLQRRVSVAKNNLLPQEGLGYLTQAPSHPWFRNRVLLEARHCFEEAIKQAENSLSEVQMALHNGEFALARGSLEKALNHNRERAATLIDRARALKSQQPFEALALLHQARELNPDMEADLLTEIALLEVRKQSGVMRPPETSQNNNAEGAQAQRLQLNAEHETLVHKLAPCTGSLIVSGPWGADPAYPT